MDNNKTTTKIYLNKIYNEDCLEGMKRIPDGSVDCILTDPPYLYLKNQKLDRPFDELVFFSECKRVLKKNGFIVLFGRGTSFYRWNCILADMGFTFKEEIIWDKIKSSSPLLPIQRVHETISIHCIGNKKIKKSHIKYEEHIIYNKEKVLCDLKRLKNVLSNFKELTIVQQYLENKSFNFLYGSKNGVTCHNIKVQSPCLGVARKIKDGVLERDVINLKRDYKAIHQTQKPVRLLERLLNIVCDEGCTVLDPFSGSASTAIACINTKRNYIGFEIDKEYYDLSVNRIKKYTDENN